MCDIPDRMLEAKLEQNRPFGLVLGNWTPLRLRASP
jgi:hypothetical protein